MLVVFFEKSILRHKVHASNSNKVVVLVSLAHTLQTRQPHDTKSSACEGINQISREGLKIHLKQLHAKDV
jgi:hypothetical protein